MNNSRNHTTYLFLGNPGAGKSTLCSALVGKTCFSSGLSCGSGLTMQFQLEEMPNGDWVGDSPGLADTATRESAAAEITKLLKSGEGLYKLIFVVTLESGRVKADDVTTIRLILDAIKGVKKIRYGIIINKASKRVMRDFADKLDSEKFKLVVSSLNSGTYGTPFIFPYAFNDDLEDQDDALHTIAPELVQWLQNLPSVHLKPEVVDEVQPNEFEAVKEQLEQDIHVLKQSKEKLEAKMKDQEDSFKTQLKEAEDAQTKRLKELEDDLNKKHEKDLSKMKKDLETSHAAKVATLRESMKADTSETLRHMERDLNEKYTQRMAEQSEKYHQQMADQSQKYNKQMAEVSAAENLRRLERELDLKYNAQMAEQTAEMERRHQETLEAIRSQTGGDGCVIS